MKNKIIKALAETIAIFLIAFAVFSVISFIPTMIKSPKIALSLFLGLSFLAVFLLNFNKEK